MDKNKIIKMVEKLFNADSFYYQEYRYLLQDFIQYGAWDNKDDQDLYSFLIDTYEDINSDGLSTDIYKKLFKIFKEHLLDKDAILKGLLKLS